MYSVPSLFCIIQLKKSVLRVVLAEPFTALKVATKTSDDATILPKSSPHAIPGVVSRRVGAVFCNTVFNWKLLVNVLPPLTVSTWILKM